MRRKHSFVRRLYPRGFCAMLAYQRTSGGKQASTKWVRTVAGRIPDSSPEKPTVVRKQTNSPD